MSHSFTFKTSTDSSSSFRAWQSRPHGMLFEIGRTPTGAIRIIKDGPSDALGDAAWCLSQLDFIALAFYQSNRMTLLDAYEHCYGISCARALAIGPTDPDNLLAMLNERLNRRIEAGHKSPAAFEAFWNFSRALEVDFDHDMHEVLPDGHRRARVGLATLRYMYVYEYYTNGLRRPKSQIEAHEQNPAA